MAKKNEAWIVYRTVEDKMASTWSQGGPWNTPIHVFTDEVVANVTINKMNAILDHLTVDQGREQLKQYDPECTDYDFDSLSYFVAPIPFTSKEIL